MSENVGLYHILSWVCLFVGWAFGLSVLVFPLGMYLASKAMEGGVDASLARKLNYWSLIATIVLLVMAFLAVILFIT